MKNYFTFVCYVKPRDVVLHHWAKNILGKIFLVNLAIRGNKVEIGLTPVGQNRSNHHGVTKLGSSAFCVVGYFGELLAAKEIEVVCLTVLEVQSQTKFVHQENELLLFIFETRSKSQGSFFTDRHLQDSEEVDSCLATSVCTEVLVNDAINHCL